MIDLIIGLFLGSLLSITSMAFMFYKMQNNQITNNDKSVTKVNPYERMPFQAFTKSKKHKPKAHSDMDAWLKENNI